MSDPIARNAAELARTLDALEQAAEQAAGWVDERDRLIRQAKALGGSHRLIAGRAELSHAGVGKLIARGGGTEPDSADVG